MRVLALLAMLAAPAAAQDACPWGGAVRKVQDLDTDTYVGSFEDEVLFGRVDGLPQCDTTVAAVRAAVKRPGCHLYADRPDALGIEMVLDCMLSETDGTPPDGITVWLSTTATEALLSEE
jgi:hypothetical protein